MPVNLGLDSMASKSKKKAIAAKKAIDRKHCSSTKDDNVANARKCVSKRAQSAEQQFPMRLRVFLSSTNHWYLQTNSCLDHKYHPKLDGDAMTLLQKDLSQQQQRLLNALCDQKIPPTTISHVMRTLSKDDKGTYLSKTLFNINEKCRNLIDVANGILPHCADAEKTLKLLEL
jgi:hypothetical protein